MPRTELIAIRVTPEEKKIISDMAWIHKKSITQLLIDLVMDQNSKDTKDQSNPDIDYVIKTIYFLARATLDDIKKGDPELTQYYKSAFSTLLILIRAIGQQEQADQLKAEYEATQIRES